ncbi:Ran GTPase [Tanacetum coccineum]
MKKKNKSFCSRVLLKEEKKRKWKRGYSQATVLKEVIINGQLAWPQEWNIRYPILDSIYTPLLVPNMLDTLEWRGHDGGIRAFSVSEVWECIRPRADKPFAGLSGGSDALISVIDQLIFLSKSNHTSSEFANLTFAAACYYIWQERNGRLFKNQRRSPNQILEGVISTRNTIYARVDSALRRIREMSESVEAFAGGYLKTPLGEPVKGKKNKTTTELWLEKFYKHKTICLKEQLVDSSSLLYDNRLQDAYINSTNIFESSIFTQHYLGQISNLVRGPRSEISIISGSFDVQLEFILFCLSRGDNEGAYQAVLSVLQEGNVASDPKANLVAGLTFSQLWYNSIQEEMQLYDSLESSSPIQSGMSGPQQIMSIDQSNGQSAVEVQDSGSHSQPDSNTSIRFGKVIDPDEVVDRDAKVKMEVDFDLKREIPEYEDIHMNSVESDQIGYVSRFPHTGNKQFGSVFYARDLETFLLPFRYSSTNTFEDFVSLQKRIKNDDYKAAVKHLQNALHSTSPAFEALLPLIQASSIL